MEVSARNIAIATGAAVLVSAFAYAIGHQRGRGREQRVNLARYRWKNRVLLVFAPNGDDPSFQQQMGQLASQSAGVRERDVLVLPILADGHGGVASRRDAAMLAKAYGVPRGAFETVLLDKDGSVVRTNERPIPVATLFDVIEGSPLRQQEPRRRTSPLIGMK